MPAELRALLGRQAELRRLRFTLDSVVTGTTLGATVPVTTTGVGELVLPDQVELRLGGPVAETAGEVELVVTGSQIYMRLGQQWLAAENNPSFAALIPAAGANFNPERALAGAQNVQRVGDETVRGVPTTVYSFALGQNQLQTPQLPGVPSTGPVAWESGTGRVWIGADGYIHRVRSDLRGRASGGGEATATTTLEFFDFDDPSIAVALPAGVTPAALGGSLPIPSPPPRPPTSPSPTSTRQ